MRILNVGERVRIMSTIPSFERRMGRVIQITEPFVRNERMKEEALLEMPLYSVRLDDGRHGRFRGRDLEVLLS